MSNNPSLPWPKIDQDIKTGLLSTSELIIKYNASRTAINDRKRMLLKEKLQKGDVERKVRKSKYE